MLKCLFLTGFSYNQGKTSLAQSWNSHIPCMDNFLNNPPFCSHISRQYNDAVEQLIRNIIKNPEVSYEANVFWSSYSLLKVPQ